MISVRASSLNGYADCHRRESAKRANKRMWGLSDVDERTNIGALMGTILHKVAEVGDPQVLQDMFCREEKGRQIHYDNATPDRRTALQQMHRMAQTLNDERPDWRRAEIIEERYETKFFGGQIALSGHPDRIDVRGDKCDVHDLKTSARQPGFKHAAQLGAYALLIFHNRDNLTPERGYVHYLPRTSMNRPQEEMHTVEFSLDSCARMAERLLKQILDHQDAQPWDLPANPASTLCTQNWCSAYGTKFCEITQKKENQHEH